MYASEQSKSKIRSTNLERGGVDHSWQSDADAKECDFEDYFDVRLS